jgi:NAD(P)-dependent dehydrogenase (short-subunit alcohol dehydrogenase family)
MISNKVIVITGAKGLIGKALVKEVNENNGICVQLDIVGENNPDANEFQCDTTDQKAVQNIIEIIVDKYGKIDGWVNNAYPRTDDWDTKFENIPFKSWKENVDMHMNGYFVCCQLVLEYMKSKGGGSLINMGSIYGSRAPDFSIYENTEMTMPAAYSAIKGGIITLTKYLASYYGSNNVRVNAVSPGGIFNNQPESFVAQYTKNVPLQRMGTPEDISPTIAFLLSDKSAYITGQNIIIDGGLTAI